MYAAFLQEVADLFNDPRFSDLSKEMTAIGDSWREFAVITGRIIKNRNKADENYDRAADQLLTIADKEERFYKELQNCIK